MVEITTCDVMMDRFIESLDLTGFNRQRRDDPVDEALAQIYEALYPEGEEPEDGICEEDGG